MMRIAVGMLRIKTFQKERTSKEREKELERFYENMQFKNSVTAWSMVFGMNEGYEQVALHNILCRPILNRTIQSYVALRPVFLCLYSCPYSTDECMLCVNAYWPQ